MKLILDTIDTEAIKRIYAITKVSGVTSNPSIVAKFAKDGDSSDMLLLKAVNTVRALDEESEFHIQVLSEKCEDIVFEAHKLQERYGNVFVKIPVTEEGLKAIRILHEEGIGVTATAIYSFMQAFLALNAGADYAALYCNRMLNNGVDYVEVIRKLKRIIPEGKILAASFKSIQQVIDAYDAGADSCTVPPELITGTLDSPLVMDAVRKFSSDWNSKFSN